MKILQNKEIYKFEETIKKSKFITYIGVIKTKEDLSNFIEKYSKKDAKHNCWAFRIGNKKTIYGYNNDGEPIGTAGEPLLKLIEVNDITNIIIFCVRYFGGIKLGTGGLQRAYSNGAIKLLKEIPIRTLVFGHHIKLEFNIRDIKLISKVLHNLKIVNLQKEFYDEFVSFDFYIENFSLLNPIIQYSKIIKNEKTYF